MPIGIFVDVASVILGGLVGSLAAKWISEELKEHMNAILGLCALCMGISTVVLMKNLPPVVFSVILGTMLGLLLSWLAGMLEKNWTYALISGFLAACADETIQRFVPDRGPSLRDVGIDTCGVAAGIALLWLGHTWYQKRKNNQHPLEEIKQ